MSYGHAERTLATIRRIEAETMAFLNSHDHLEPEQEKWLCDAVRRTGRGSPGAPGAKGPTRRARRPVPGDDGPEAGWKHEYL
jgi:hypothetical protein